MIEHVMKPIFGKIKVRKLLSFDTEDDTRGNLILGNIFDGKDYFWYKNQDEFINHLRDISKKYGKEHIYLVATNLEYDMINSFKGYYNRVELMYAGHLINFKLKESNIYGMDSLNHYKDGIQAQGERLGLNKIEIKVSDIKNQSENDIKKYNARDTEICLAAMELHQKSVNKFGGELRDTAAGTALNLFRRRFLHTNIKRPENDDLYFMKRGYYGGRTEIFNMELKSNKNNIIHYYDINSLYPDVMLHNKFPDPNSIFHDKNIELEGVSECEIEYIHPDDIYIPYFPYKFDFTDNKEIMSLAHKKDINLDDINNMGGIRLMFPVGKLRGCWSNFEIRYGISKGLIRLNKLIRSVNFTDSDYYFKEYMEYMYNERKKYKTKNDLFSKYMSQNTKLYMNSLYGKFFEHVDSKVVSCDENGIIDINLKENYWPNHSNGIWSLMTTAYARTKEYEGLLKVHEAGGKLGYCDTDCNIYLGPEGILPVSNEIGDFKEEGTYKYARFYLPKTYMLVDMKNEAYITAKGIPSNNDPLDKGQYDFIREGWTSSDDSFKISKKYKYKLKFLKTGKVTVKKPVRFKESFRSVQYNRQPNVWRDTEKVMKARYMKRVVLNNGDTRPYILKNGKMI